MTLFMTCILQVSTEESKWERQRKSASVSVTERESEWVLESKGGWEGERNRQFGNKWRTTVDALHLRINGNDPCLCFALFVFSKLASLSLFFLSLFLNFLWKKPHQHQRQQQQQQLRHSIVKFMIVITLHWKDNFWIIAEQVAKLINIEGIFLVIVIGNLGWREGFNWSLERTKRSSKID